MNDTWLPHSTSTRLADFPRVSQKRCSCEVSPRVDSHK
jgi:hypothetical protein